MMLAACMCSGWLYMRAGACLFALGITISAQAQLAPARQPATQLGSNRYSESGQAATRQSYLRPVPRDGQLRAGGAETALRPTAGAATRLERVQQLKQALKARETEQNEIVIDLPSDVLFDFDQSTLRPDAIPVLAQAAQLIAAYPQAPVCINGYTDSKGSDSYNQALSMRRARAVAAQLQSGQAAQEMQRTMQVRGLGESMPVAANTLPDGADNPEGRQRNRRVEIIIGALSSGTLSARQGVASCR